MQDELLKELVEISHIIGQKSDFVQGGGGNTSVKIDENTMAIKASGFNLSDIREDDGVVLVEHQKIKSYYRENSNSLTEDQAISFNRSTVLKSDLSEDLRPSIETGFHALLDKFVIHSHSVYVNIVSCAEGGEGIMHKIFKDSDLNILWLDYFSPGLYLTLGMSQLLGNYHKSEFPDAVFMKNHGLVVNAKTSQKAVEIHQEINSTIKKYFSLDKNYPQIEIKQLNENLYQSNSEYLLNFLRQNPDKIKNFPKQILFPDQVVFGDDISFQGLQENKINFDLEENQVFYKASKKQAKTIEELLIAWIFIIENIENQGLQLEILNNEQVEYIRQMSSEKYRKKLIK